MAVLTAVYTHSYIYFVSHCAYAQNIQMYTHTHKKTHTHTHKYKSDFSTDASSLQKIKWFPNWL